MSSLFHDLCGKPVEAVSTPFGRTQRHELPCVLDVGHDGPCCLAKYDQEDVCTAGPNAGSSESLMASTVPPTGSRGSGIASSLGGKTAEHGASSAFSRIRLYRGVKATWPIPHGAERDVTEVWVALCDAVEAAAAYAAAVLRGADLDEYETLLDKLAVIGLGEKA